MILLHGNVYLLMTVMLFIYRYKPLIKIFFIKNIHIIHEV